MKVDHKYIIAIDPDKRACGVAYCLFEANKIYLYESAPEHILHIAYPEKTLFLIEAGWLASGNWHLHSTYTVQVAAKIGRDVGENHGVGRLMANFLKEKHDVVLVRPGAGGHSKKTQAQFKKDTGLTASFEIRDAYYMLMGASKFLEQDLSSFEVKKT